MSGQEIKVPLSTINSVALGGYEQRQIPVGVFDLTEGEPDFKGISGFLSLKYFENVAFTFDRKKNGLVIENDASLEER